MKKSILSFFAVIIALAATAFTTVSNHSNGLYIWYDVQGNQLNTIPSELPPNGCDQGEEVCAYGHESTTSTPRVGYKALAMFP